MDTSAKRANGTWRIFIVDDHPIVCRGLAELINHEEDLTVCGQAESAEQGLEDILQLKPDLALLDISLKGMSGIELIKHLRVRLPELAILVISMHDETLYAERVLRAGAKGYIMKEEATEKLLDALRLVLGGEGYVSAEMSRKIIRGVVAGHKTSGESPLAALSDRELEVFQLIGGGLRTREIAEKLHLAVKTIEAYRANIKEKLGLKNYMELVKAAILYVGAEDGWS